MNSLATLPTPVQPLHRKQPKNPPPVYTNSVYLSDRNLSLDAHYQPSKTFAVDRNAPCLSVFLSLALSLCSICGQMDEFFRLMAIRPYLFPLKPYTHTLTHSLIRSYTHASSEYNAASYSSSYSIFRIIPIPLQPYMLLYYSNILDGMCRIDRRASIYIRIIK